MVPALEETLKTNLFSNLLSLPDALEPDEVVVLDDELELELEEVPAELAEEVVVLVSVRLDEYFSVMLVTLMRRYLRVLLVGGGSAR